MPEFNVLQWDGHNFHSDSNNHKVMKNITKATRKTFVVVPVVAAIFPAPMLFVAILLLSAICASAQFPPGFKGGPTNTPLDSWSFHDSTYWTDDGSNAPISFVNLASSPLGDGFSLVVATNVPAWLNYNIYEPTTGATNLVVDGPGSITFWYAPEWSTTNGGPGQWAQLMDAGEWTPDASSGYWGLSVDPSGSNLLFSVQDGSGDSYGLFTPISWTTNYFHYISLTWSGTNVSLYLDGQQTTNDPGGLNLWPGPEVLANGIYFGSDTNGNEQAQGLFNTVATYSYPLSSNDVQTIFNWNYGMYMINPWNIAAMSQIISAPSSQTTFTPFNDVITGAGNLQLIGSAPSCVDGTNAYNVWITNVLAMTAGNGTMNLKFTIEGGSNGVPFDVFANSVLSFGPSGIPWAWEGQGYQCNTYELTNLPNTGCFLILGTPQDSDHDGLTDAFEGLVSKSNPTNYSTDGTGMADGWEFLYFGHTGIDPNGDPDGDGLSNYQEFQMYPEGYSPVKWDSSTNSIVGDGYQDYDGDGLANLMEATFGGNMLTNSVTWKVNTSGDGFPDEYKTLVGLNPSSAQPAPGLPAYSKNPIQ
jgi:hypothetical protein